MPARAVTSAEVAAAIDRHLGLYLALPHRREKAEGVRVNGDRVELWFLRPVRRDDRDEAGCDAVRWLLRGRLARADGVIALFSELSDVKEVALVFYAAETRVEPDANGRYIQHRDASPQARVAISREKAAMLDPRGLAQALQGPGCAERGREMVDVFWVK